MIFSFSEGHASELNLDLPEIHVFCFFSTSLAVKVPVSEWWKGIAASLRMKKSVLILEDALVDIPLNTSARWLVGDKFLWLHPRSLSVFLEATHQNSYSYLLVKASLISRN
jgi:hypothetical protein